MEVVPFVPQLGKALWNLKVMYDQHVENGNEIKELQSFIQDYDQQIPILRERFQEGGGSVIGIVAFKNLEKDVMDATKKLERWSRDKSFFRVFNSPERMQKLGKLHSKVMASVQKSLGIANLSMLLDLQATQATILESNVDLQTTQATILESNAELKSLLITSIRSMHGTLPAKVRDEVVEASTSTFGDPKFWEDILAAVDNHNVGVSEPEEKNSYKDPITSNLMIDPIVASDGNTYCRWTIIDNNLTTNPFNVDEDLTIVIDNLAFRRGLFEKFPQQAQIFRQRRNQYRSHAFSLKAQGLWGDAILALHYVLQWDKHDAKCIEALEQAQGALQEAKKKYLQPSMGLPNEPGNGGSIGASIELHEAYKFFPSLLSSPPKDHQQAAYGICQWSKRDVKFQSYIVQHGGIPLLATLLPSSDEITQEHIVSILFDIKWSWRWHKHQTMLGALMSIAEVLKEGSPQAHEHAARILFNVSTYPHKKTVTGFSVAMHALITSLGDGTLQVQQIVSSTLNNISSSNFFSDFLFVKKASDAGLVSILLRLIAKQSTTILEEVLPLMYQLLHHYYRASFQHDIKSQAPVTTWLEIMASKSPLNQERAASILYNLCYNNQEYRRQARECHACERITQFTLPTTTKHSLVKLLYSNTKYPTRELLPFPDKDWWSPLRDEH